MDVWSFARAAWKPVCAPTRKKRETTRALIIEQQIWRNSHNKSPMQKSIGLLLELIFLRHQNGIHNVDNAVRLIDITDGDARNATFGINDFEILAFSLENERFALHGFQFRAAFVLFDELDKICRAVFARNDVISQNRSQRRLVFGLDEGFDSSGGQFSKRGVGRREHGEGAGAGQRFDQTGGSHSRDKRGVVFGINGIFDDVLRRIHRGAAHFNCLLGSLSVSDGRRCHRERVASAHRGQQRQNAACFKSVHGFC